MNRRLNMNLDVLPGKKTYLLLAGFAVYTVVRFYAGEIDFDTLIETLFGESIVATIKAGWDRKNA